MLDKPKWLGHVLRMDDERIANIILKGKVEGTRRRGKRHQSLIN